MEIINFKDNHKVLKDVIPLFIEAFPEDERPPVFIFKRTVKRKSSELLTFYDHDEFVGFSLLTFYKWYAYMYFLAVEKKKRNQGYGGEILKSIFNLFSDTTIFLLHEEIDDKYPDNEMRKRRKTFYLRNGFKENGFKTNEFGVVYDSCYHGPSPVSFEQYFELMRHNVGKIIEHNIKRVA